MKPGMISISNINGTGDTRVRIQNLDSIDAVMNLALVLSKFSQKCDIPQNELLQMLEEMISHPELRTVAEFEEELIAND